MDYGEKVVHVGEVQRDQLVLRLRIGKLDLLVDLVERETPAFGIRLWYMELPARITHLACHFT